MASAAVYLASDEAENIDGQRIIGKTVQTKGIVCPGGQKNYLLKWEKLEILFLNHLLTCFLRASVKRFNASDLSSGSI